MKVKKLLLPLSIICISLFALTGCTKTTDYKAGAYTASNKPTKYLLKVI